MGNTREVLLNQPAAKSMFNKRLTVELCENVHLHYRNMRLEFSKDEFVEILRELKQIDEEIVESFEYGNDKFLSLINKEILPDSCEFDDRLQVEEQAEGHYHIHYRNLRLELQNLMEFGFRCFDVPMGLDPEWSSNKKIISVNLKRHKLSSLRTCVYDEGDSVGTWIPLEETATTKYLKGDKEAYTSYLEVVKQVHPGHAAHSVERLEELKRSIESKGYSGSFIVTVGSDPLIADGQHRASILYHLFGDIEVITAGVIFEKMAALECGNSLSL